jgi:M6 family metalloprotease-like protein
VLEVIFVDWPDKPSPSTDTAADFDALWAKITSNGELSHALTRQGFKGNLIVNVRKQWKRLPQNLTYYAPNDTTFKYQDFVAHSLALLGNGPFPSNTIAVVIPDETPVGESQIKAMSASAHGVNHHGIRSTILLTDKTYSESYTILLHEMGHSFGAPDLYPVTGAIHLVGGYGMMGDARGARHFLGWHKFRWGWLAADRTTLLNKQGIHDISLSGISNSSDQSMIVIPDPNVFAKLWVIECGQDIQHQADFKLNNGNFLAYEGDRLIVYTVEGNPAADLRPIRLAFRTTPPDPAAHLTTGWLDAVSYVQGQSMAAGAAPFSLNVLAKTDFGYDIRVTLATDLEGGLYNVPKDQFSPNGEYVLRFQSDGNVVVRRFPSEAYVWDAINSGKWFVGSASNFHFSYKDGTLKRISNATGSVIDQRVVQANAPAGSFLGVNDAGVIQVVTPPSSATLTTAAYTGSDPTLNGGALYGFPIVSDTKSSPATLTITSTSAGTILTGASAVTGNNINTGFRTNINLTHNPGESVVAQTISLTTGQFDDGLRLDYNGVKVLDFDYSNWNIPAVNSMFSGAWTPWTNEGSPAMELDAAGLRLMVTAVSNGTGAAAGVLAGQRVNVLNYFTSDAYVRNPAKPDFVSGVQIGLYNRNNQGAWAISNATMTATARVIPRHTAQISRAPGGNPSLLFQCIASQSYLIQRSTDLLNWTTIQTATAAANGTLSYTDNSPPVGRAFYRIAVP